MSDLVQAELRTVIGLERLWVKFLEALEMQCSLAKSRFKFCGFTTSRIFGDVYMELA